MKIKTKVFFYFKSCSFSVYNKTVHSNDKLNLYQSSVYYFLG